jgi:predicted transcriptional regulator
MEILEWGDDMKFPLRGKKVNHVMTRGVVTVNEKAPAKEVFRAMVENDVAGIVVVSDEGYCRGVVTTYDVLGLGHLSVEEIKGLTAEDLMTKYTVDVNPTDTLEAAGKIMREYRIHRLIVGSGKPIERKPIGVLSSTDVVKYLYENLP